MKTGPRLNPEAVETQGGLAEKLADWERFILPQVPGHISAVAWPSSPS